VNLIELRGPFLGLCGAGLDKLSAGCEGATRAGAIPAARGATGRRQAAASLRPRLSRGNHGELPSQEIPKRPAQATRPAPCHHQCQIATALQRRAGRRGRRGRGRRGRRVSRHHLPGLWLSHGKNLGGRHGRRGRWAGAITVGACAPSGVGPATEGAIGISASGRGEVVAPLLAPLG